MLKLTDVDMSSPHAKSSIYLFLVGFEAENLTLHDVYTISSQGAAIFGVDLSSIYILNSEFRNLTAIPGGAISLSQKENLKNGALNTPAYTIESVKFIDCDSNTRKTNLSCR